MKTLLLLRHAKSSSNDPSLGDFDRPLNQSGLEAAAIVGREMRKRKLQPDLVLSSPAKRAKQTAQIVIESARLTAELRFDELIYEASAQRLLEIVSQIEEPANTAMLVGHNPGCEDLLEVLTGEDRHLPTATVARIELNVDRWSEAGTGVGSLDWVVAAKKLEGD
jgi:phosphohistidine phosphatase